MIKCKKSRKKYLFYQWKKSYSTYPGRNIWNQLKWDTAESSKVIVTGDWAMLDFTNMFLSLCFLLISKALADEYSKGYLRREHSIFKGKMTKSLLKIFMQESSKIELFKSWKAVFSRMFHFLSRESWVSSSFLSSLWI